MHHGRDARPARPARAAKAAPPAGSRPPSRRAPPRWA